MKNWLFNIHTKGNLMSRTLNHLSVFLLLTSLIQCTSLARGDQVQATGEVASSTNNLFQPTKIDLYLDQIKFDGHLGSDTIVNTHPDFEIHIMDQAETKLLACVSSIQKTSLGSMGEDFITYAHIEAPFVASIDAPFAADTPVTLRFIEKHTNSSCPLGYDGGNPNIQNDSNADRVLAKEHIKFGELTTQKIIFENTATTAFKTAAQDFWAVEETPTEVNGILSADQILLNDAVDFGEFTSPELALLIYEVGQDHPEACADLWDVDADDVLYGTMRYDFLDSEDRDVRLSALNPAKSFVLKLVELDEADCLHLLKNEDGIGIGVAVLDVTDDIPHADLTNGPFEFKNNTGDVLLVTR